MRYIIYPLLFFFLYRFLVRFLIPLFQVTRVASQRMREMQSQMENMEQKSNASSTTHTPRQVDGDYIEYEEVK
jgi:hypothetical protein